jgi:hypothetical protein
MIISRVFIWGDRGWLFDGSRKCKKGAWQAAARPLFDAFWFPVEVTCRASVYLVVVAFGSLDFIYWSQGQ